MTVDVFIGALGANVVTIWCVYWFWRLTKNEHDMAAMSALLAAFALIGLFGYAAMPSRAPSPSEPAPIAQAQTRP